MATQAAPAADTRQQQQQPAAKPAATNASRRRAKSFLRNYYGLQQSETSPQSGSKDADAAQRSAAAKSDPYDIDGHSFEVDKYMHKMFVEKQLPGLIQADNDLVADIRQLDGDMKTLVYENYSKFLSATDTINKMKSNVDNLESEMARLTQNIGKIAASSSTINNSLGTKREKIRQLNGVHSLLTKLQFVFELPANLNHCLETGSYTQAVKSYCRTLHLLQHYNHLTVFTGIERECKAIMVTIAHRIRQNMSREEATGAEISDSVGLLLALKENPETLWKKYLELSTKFLDKQYKKTLDDIQPLPLYQPPPPATPGSAKSHPATASSLAAAAAATPKKAISKRLSKSPFPAATAAAAAAAAAASNEISRKSEALEAEKPEDKIAYLNHHYLSEIEDFVASFRNYFLLPSNTSATGAMAFGGKDTTEEKGSSSLVVVAGGGGAAFQETEEEDPNGTARYRPAWFIKETRAATQLTKEQRSEANRAIKDAASKLTHGYLDTVRTFLEFPDNVLTMQPAAHIHVLKSLQAAAKSCKALCQLMGFDGLATGLVQDWESQLVERVLVTIKTELLSRISKQDKETQAAWGGVTSSSSSSSSSSSPTTSTSSSKVQQQQGSNGGLLAPGSVARQPTLGRFIQDTKQWLVDTLCSESFPFVESYMTNDVQFMSTKAEQSQFLKTFQSGFKGFWDQVLQSMQNMATEKDSSPTISLLMSQLCFELSTSAIERLYKTLSKTIFRPGAMAGDRRRARSNSFSIESYEDHPVLPELQWDSKSTIEACKDGGHALLDGFIERVGKDLSWLIMQGLETTTATTTGAAENYLTMPAPPTRVSAAWEQVYRQLNMVEQQVLQVFGEDGDRTGAGRTRSSESNRHEPFSLRPGGSNGSKSNNNNNNNGGGGGGSSSNGGGGGHLSITRSHRNDSHTSFGSSGHNAAAGGRFGRQQQQQDLLMSNIDKLFSDRVDIFTRCLDMNRTGILFGIVKIVLKAAAEAVRLGTYGRGGLQQIQVDAEFAKVWLWRFSIADERFMYSILEETQQTAYRRCIDPVPLDASAVEAIISSTAQRIESRK
ncbi:Vacuolar protein sorting-associated protein 51 [Actinomortierella ambigua]|uniref:Vacuolar protein sorting-associated protein 51 n=1 Tax=Actinomortierella ambigua TaxID=1343610 RepID=A0A9P6PSE2_9FUNG|nr:Vacuolar protein sorting-associated protein 51 [Actinomortierella ambigua]